MEEGFYWNISVVASFAIALQVLFQGVWFGRLAFFKPAPLSSPSVGVSVIVVARNECDHLAHLLPLLLEQDYPAPYEIIIADDNSTDETFWLLKTASQSFQQLKVVTVQYTPPGIHPKKYALTLAIKAAQYNYLILTDADCRPQSNRWLATMAAHFSNGKQIVLGYSPYYPQKGFLNRFICYETLLTGMQYLSAALWGFPYMGVGRNLAYTKSVFMDNKGFGKHQHITGGDDDLFVNKVARSSNTAVALGAEALVYSFPKTSWSQWWQQKRRHLSVGKYYRLKDKFWLGFNTTLNIIATLLPLVAIALTFTAQQWQATALVGGMVLIRWALLASIAYLCAKKVGEVFSPFWYPILDFFYVIYYISTAFSVLISNKVKWK
ncbi:MAG: glycosyltransferase [Cytophagales bacterium]|nr:glycosyltransferase [Bernardetiaceae bacterium]MDW8211451.1 glycosyltransferase [Cytophagales bacterium]